MTEVTVFELPKCYMQTTADLVIAQVEELRNKRKTSITGDDFKPHVGHIEYKSLAAAAYKVCPVCGTVTLGANRCSNCARQIARGAEDESRSVRRSRTVNAALVPSSIRVEDYSVYASQERLALAA